MRRSAFLITAAIFLLGTGIAEARGRGHASAPRPVKKPYLTGGLTSESSTPNLKWGVRTSGKMDVATKTGKVFKIPEGKTIIAHPTHWFHRDGMYLTQGARAINTKLREKLNLPPKAQVRVTFLSDSSISFHAKVTNVPMKIVAKGQYYGYRSSRAGVTFREISMSLDEK